MSTLPGVSPRPDHKNRNTQNQEELLKCTKYRSTSAVAYIVQVRVQSVHFL